MTANMISSRSRAGRPRRLAPLPSAVGLNTAPVVKRSQSRANGPAARSLAQRLLVHDLLRLPGEKDRSASRRLRALLRLCEDQHRAFAANGGVARYEASQLLAHSVPNDERHLRKIKALARYTAVLKALPSEQCRLIESLVGGSTEQILTTIQANKARCCRALDCLLAVFAELDATKQGGLHG